MTTAINNVICALSTIVSYGGKARASMSMSVLHLRASSLTFMSPLHLHAACPFSVSILHVHTACSCYISMLQVHSILNILRPFHAV
jgi:hypothetical protein